MRHRAAPEGNDFYVTPPGTAWHGATLVHALHERLRGACTVFDAGCGQGALTHELEAMRIAPYSFDMNQADGFEHDVVDVFGEGLEAYYRDVAGTKGVRVTISNPPYGKWREFVGALLEVSDVVFALGPLTLADAKLELPGQLVAIHVTPRPCFVGKSSHPIPHAWFHLRRDNTSETPWLPALVTLPDASLRKQINEHNRAARKLTKTAQQSNEHNDTHQEKKEWD